MIIGLVGPSLSGKNFFIEIISELAHNKRIAIVNTGELLKKTLDLWHLSGTRKNYQKLPEIMCGGYGEDVFSEVIGCEVGSKIATHDAVIINALRLPPDLHMLRSFYPNMLIALTADDDICVQRANQRREKVGEEHLTLEQFLDEQNAYTERFIKRISQYADVPALVNNGTRDEFREQIIGFYVNHIKPILMR